MEELKLTAGEFAESDAGLSWRWVLAEPGGAFVDDHDVRIAKSAWQYHAFTSLYGWLGDSADSMDRQAELVADLGEWITRQVFGRIAAKIARESPCRVRVSLPGPAAALAFLPLELARQAGRPLAVQRVSLVIDLGGAPVQARPEPGGGPRVLGLFSLPGSRAPLNLRRERYELERLARELSGAGRAITLRTLQYGTTRDKLAEAVEDGDGWDVVHLSGHGHAGEFVLETPDGERAPIAWEELARLLGPLRGRVRLVTISSCESGDRIGRQQLRMLFSDHRVPGNDTSPDDGGGPRALASELAEHLRCAVIGMRYPVAESFAASFTSELYRLMFDKGQPLATARASALASVASGHPTIDRPALSAAVPALYGASAIDLKLTAPKVDRPVIFSHEVVKLAGLPSQPARLIGRGTEMSRASHALAQRSGRSAVVLHGPAKTGKTTLAAELAYTQRDNFQDLIWYAAPEREAAVAALDGLAAALDQKIGGLNLTAQLAGERRLRDFLPGLTELFEGHRILLVIDNAQTLLSPAGSWRDPRLGLVFGALTGHDGQGRVIVTTRSPISAPDAGPVTEHVGALLPTEAILLAHELARLRALLDGSAPPLNESAARSLARNVLVAAHGYPYLMELAEHAAADPRALARLTLLADQAWQAAGTETAGYLAVLEAWSGGAL